MIKLMEDEFEPWDIDSARILAARRTYDDAQCWQQSDTAIISLVDGFALLSAREDADWEELAAFLQMLPWDRLRCDAALATRLPFRLQQLSIMVHFVAPKKVGTPNPAQVTDVNEIYDILEKSFPEVDNAVFAADLALRWKCGTAKTWALNGASTVSAMELTERYCFLGAVGTLPQARGRGYAGQLLAHIATLQQNAGREVYLCCREELLPFYESVGFMHSGNLAILQKEDNE